jgi:hypothetical protein
MEKGNKHIVLTVLATLGLLAGCVSFDTSWTPTTGTGPYLSGTSFARVFQKCEQRLMDGARQCKIAFEDEAGKKHEVFHDLVSELDDQVLRIPEAATWQRTKSSPAEIIVPYKLFLVTLAPIIIIAVPAPLAATEPCWSDAPRGNCLRSYVAANNGYSLSTTFPAVAGTRWLSPMSTSSRNLVPTGPVEYDFPLENVNAKLIRQGDNWQFIREKNVIP